MTRLDLDRLTMRSSQDDNPVHEYAAVSEPAFAIEELSVRYGDKGPPSLTDLNITINRGAFTSLLGPSGCGKSTLLRVLGGLMEPTSGTARYRDRLISGPLAEGIFVFQAYDRSLLPWATVEQNVALGLTAKGAYRGRRRRADIRDLCGEALADVGLVGHGSKFPGQLSGGMQQRVALARALVCSPDVLLLDETFSAVDALSRSSLQDLLLRIWQRTQVTIVFVTHDIDEAIYLSDRVIVLSKSPGRVVGDIVVDLERPRNQIQTRENVRFLALRRDVYALVAGDGPTHG